MRCLPFLILYVTALSVRAADFGSEVLAEMNLARTAPQAYAAVVAAAPHRGSEGQSAVDEAVRFLMRARPLPPLSAREGIVAAARDHVEDQGPRAARGHKGSDRSAPWDRMARYGAWSGRAGENIHYGRATARAVVVALIIDDGVRGRGHRKNIFNSTFSVAGAASGEHARFGRMCVIDFAGGFTTGPSRSSVASVTRFRSPWTTTRGVL